MNLQPDYKIIRSWWNKKRLKYNTGLIISGITAFIAYAILGGSLIAPHDIDFEITLFTIFFQGMAYLIMIGFANILYSLGFVVDKKFNKLNSMLFRQRLYNLGFWFSVGLPFIIPILIVIVYFVNYH